MRIEVRCTNTVMQWLAHKARQGTARVQGIGRRSFLFGKPRVPGCLGGAVGFDIVLSFGTERRGGMSRVHRSLCAPRRTRTGLYTFGAKTPVVDFGIGGIRLVVFQQDNWIIYTASKEIRV